MTVDHASLSRRGSWALFLVERGVLICHAGGSRMTIHLRIPTMSGQSTSGFHRPGRHWQGGGSFGPRHFLLTGCPQYVSVFGLP